MNVENRQTCGESGNNRCARHAAVLEQVNRISLNPSFIPRWSDKPLLKSYEETNPPLDGSRTTDSLCPN